MPKAKKSKNNKPVKPAFHIYCEGEKTEPYYIKGFIEHFYSSYRNILIIENTNKNTPVQLVEEAINAKKIGAPNDIYWVVFDRESTSKYSLKYHNDAY